MAPQKAVKKSEKKNRLIIQGPDFWGNEVQCTADHWTGHIIEPLDGHPELTGLEREVAKTILDPELIRPSTTTGKAFAFDRVLTADAYPLPLRVIVGYTDKSKIKEGSTSGWISTAYFDDPAYPSQVGEPIYRKAATKTASQNLKKKEGDA